MTRKSLEIETIDDGAYVQVNPADAEKLDIVDGEIVMARSRRGQISLPVKISDKIEAGVVFMPFHYKEAAANLLTNDALDPISKIPEAKVCAIRLEKQR
jgi:predicted molibdopterin-dependent oxidoreductase YjgC